MVVKLKNFLNEQGNEFVISSFCSIWIALSQNKSFKVYYFVNSLNQNYVKIKEQSFVHQGDKKLPPSVFELSANFKRERKQIAF